MPLRFVKIPKPNVRLNSGDVLQVGITTTALAKELATMTAFPPATAAVSLVLLILQTLQGVQANKEACFRLARRCARILLDINDQMDGRWDKAPPTLIKNLERFRETLSAIHEFMKIQTELKWSDRFLKKSSIENALDEYRKQLDDAAQSFQIAALIDIHYAVSSQPNESPRDKERITSPPPPPYRRSGESNRARSRSPKASKINSPNESVEAPGSPPQSPEQQSEEQNTEEIISNAVLEDRGFRRYHQSDVRLKGKSTLKGGWWSGVGAAEVEGQPSLAKRYDGPLDQALKLWMNDVKLLQDVYHPNLPQLVGFSGNDAPTPFILLSHVQTRSPQSLLRHVVKTQGLAAAAGLLLSFYQDVTDATTYIQRQRGLNENQAQDFVGGASYRVDGSNTVIMGLPPPNDGWVTARNYGLTESLKMVVLGMLPNSGLIQYKRTDDVDDGDDTRRISHLVSLVRGLLPSDDSPISLQPRVKALIGTPEEDSDNDEESFIPTTKFNLRQLRLSNIEAGTHDHVWHENGGVPAHKFTVGDYGYMPPGNDFKDFVILGNVIKDELATLQVESTAHGSQWSWKDFPIRHVQIEPYTMPDGARCWPMAVPPSAQIDCQIVHSSMVLNIGDTWRFLLLRGKDLATKHNVKPEDLILITRAGTNQDFYIRDFRTAQVPLQHQPLHQHRGGFGFNNAHAPMRHPMPFPPQNTLPAIMYLLTSPDRDYLPYWAQEPISMSESKQRPSLKHGWTYKIGFCTGFVNWIQLHPEDFTN